METTNLILKKLELDFFKYTMRKIEIGESFKENIKMFDSGKERLKRNWLSKKR
jgi:hypothetical protein